MGIACGGADDDDDPPCVTDVGNVCDVETADETSLRRLCADAQQ